VRATLALLVLPLALLVAGCGGGAGRSTTQSSAGCTTVETPSAREQGTNEPPTSRLAPGKTYTLVFDTNCGSFTVTLDQQSSPKTVASLVALARTGYFDDTIFHRVDRGFVIQGGDPTQTGGGGPGYSTVDPPPADAKYTRGVVAMAKTPTEPAGTAGSQFFVVTADDAQLSPDYAIVGQVTDGMGAVERIDALGQTNEQGQSVDGPPSQPVVISKVTVAES
jgi:cyclophilin family peptidyl-prolyl cis-trans isomerase